jgi:SAM-dependent methyltransferase
MNPITHLSPEVPVHMSDAWFEIVTLDHFWIKRRFEVFMALWRGRQMTPDVAEIGCGHGLVLSQLKKAFGIHADGYDLNESALKQADPKCGRLFYYNVHDRAASLHQAYKVIFAFDVIEHLEDDNAFLESVLFHLKPGGHLIVNLPAHKFLHSHYDRLVGHQRRYDIGMLRKLCDRTGLTIETWSYWGLMYIPILLLRRQMLEGVPDSEVTRRGFALQSAFSNQLLLFLGRMERLPNRRYGTSVMAILKYEN